MKRFINPVLAAMIMVFASTPVLAAEIKVCIWGTITGPDALVNGMSYGTRDYFEYLNETKGGIAGNKVTSLMLDGRYKLDEELKIYRRCVDQERSVVINGWSTGAVKALREQINSDGVTFITESFSGEVVDPVKLPYIFIAGPTYEQQIIIGLQDLKNRGGKKVIFMHGDNEYGRAPVTVVRKMDVIQKLGLQLVDTVEFPFDTQDVTAQLLRIKAKSPDLIYVQGSTPQMLAVLRDAAKVGLSAKLFMGNLYNISPSIPEQLGGSANGFRAIQAYADFGANVPAMKEIEAFRTKHEVTRQDVYYMKGWFKGKVIAAAIANSLKKYDGKPPADIKVFRKSVRDELEGLKGLDVGGITPPVDYANHQGSLRARIVEIKDGKYVPISDWIESH